MMRNVLLSLAPIVGCQPHSLAGVHFSEDTTTPWMTFGKDGTLHALFEESHIGRHIEGGALHAINQDGSTKWIFNASRHGVSGLNWHAEGTKHTIYAASTLGNTLVAIDRSNGHLQWQHTAQLRAGGKGKVAVASDGTVFFESFGLGPNITSDLDVFHANGTLKWRRHLHTSTAFIDPDRGVLVQDSHLAEDDSLLRIGRMAMLSPENGHVKWKWTSPEASDISPLFFLEDGSVLVLLRTLNWGPAHHSISLIRLRAGDGRMLWNVSSTGFSGDFAQTYVFRGKDKVYVNEWFGEDGSRELRAFDFDGNSLGSMPRLTETGPCRVSSDIHMGDLEFTHRHAFNAEGDRFVLHQTCADESRNHTSSVLAYSGTDGTLLWETSEFDYGDSNQWVTGLELGIGQQVFATSQSEGWHNPVDQRSFTSAIRNGSVAWTVQTTTNNQGSSHPIVADDGTSYILGRDEVVAVGMDGLEKWRHSAFAENAVRQVLV